MELLEQIINTILLTENVSIEQVQNAIDRHVRVIISYHTNGEDEATGARIVEVYAYGLTKAGNPVIRCFQPYGDTTSRVPSWKFFRLDRISAWKPTNQIFTKPADFYYKNIGDFNPDGDDTMSVVYKIASFGDDVEKHVKNGPKTKSEIYKTDTEKRMERLRQQLTNPIKLSDLKFDNQAQNNKPMTGPIKKDRVDIYKTDTEKRMERLRQQLENPVKMDLSKIDNNRFTRKEEDNDDNSEQTQEEI